MAELGATHTKNRFHRTVYPVGEPQVNLSMIELEQTCPNQRQKLLLLQSCEKFHVHS